MDKLILGLLMLNRLTIYEMRSIVQRNFWGICSDSTGSLQAAIKKLLAAEMVCFEEYVEKSVNKKRYSITDKGREAFAQWVQTPADMTTAANMELAKILMMGLAPASKRGELIDELIANMEKELVLHQELQATLNAIDLNAAYGEIAAIWKQDPEYHMGVQNAIGSTDDKQNFADIAFYQTTTLQYAIDGMKFEIEWFKQLKERAKQHSEREK